MPRLFILRFAKRSSRTRLQRGHRRQGLAFEEFEEGAATGGDVRDIVLDAVLVDGRERVAATGDRERLARGDRARVSVPLPKASNSNTPTGPFHTTVPAALMSSA